VEAIVMLEIILDSLVPIFFGMALGYLGGWTRDIDNKHVAELNAGFVNLIKRGELVLRVLSSYAATSDARRHAAKASLLSCRRLATEIKWRPVLKLL
jgi:hypothetical protein